MPSKEFKGVENHQKDFQNLKKVRIRPYVVTCDEQDIINALQVAFEGENKRIDAYFSEYKLGIEIDEYNHERRNFNYEKSRQLMIESHGITIIRINPDAADFDLNMLINQIYKHISQSNKEKLEKEKEAEIKNEKTK